MAAILPQCVTDQACRPCWDWNPLTLQSLRRSETTGALAPGRLAAAALGPHISRGPVITVQPPMTEETAAETRSFQAEVSRLLDIVAHSLYSEKEIFLRELISNASDACDRLRYAALTQPELAGEDSNFRVVLTPDKTARSLTVDDNGVRMNHDELIENLGTIARSGTAALMETLAGDKGKAGANGKDVSLIGQFGVGFYSAFMVADNVEVIARKGS